MSRQIKEKVLALINQENPLPKALQLLKDLPEGRDSEFMKEVVLRILQTMHDWDTIRQCLKKWKTFTSWGNEFLKRMYWRIDENSSNPNFIENDKIDEEIGRTSKLYWEKVSPRKQPSSKNNDLMREYLYGQPTAKFEFNFEEVPEKKQNQKEPTSIRHSQRKFTFDPKNIEASIEDTLRRQTFLNTGKVEPAAHVINHVWKFEPSTERSPLFQKQTQENKPIEVKTGVNQVTDDLSFSNNKSSSKNARPTIPTQPTSTNLLTKLQKNVRDVDNDLSFNFSPINPRKIPPRSDELLDWSFKSTVKPKQDEGHRLDDFAPMVPKNNRISIGTEYNQLFPRETKQLLERNGYYKAPATNNMFENYKKSLKPKGTIEYFLDSLDLNR